MNKIKPIILIILFLGVCLILLAIIFNWDKLTGTKKDLPFVEYMSTDLNCAKSYRESHQGDTPISIKEINSYCGKISRLYIQPNQNKVKVSWAEAVSYCENLKVNGYDDWNLPIFADFAKIQFGVTDENKSLLQINTEIASTYTGDFDPFIDDYYWRQGVTGPGLFNFDVAKWVGALILSEVPETSYVRCVRES